MLLQVFVLPGFIAITSSTRAFKASIAAVLMMRAGVMVRPCRCSLPLFQAPLVDRFTSDK
jgi:hypothetical protein